MRHAAFLRNLILAVTLLNLLVAATICYALWRSHSHYAHRAVVGTQNISQVMDESLSGLFSKIDLGLQAVTDEAERQLEEGGIAPAKLDAFLVREHRRMPELVALRATDPQGEAVYGPQQIKPKTTISVAHRDYFATLRDRPEAGMVISAPLVGGITGKWMVVLARRINRPDGSFGGLVYAGLDLDYLSRQFSRINNGKQGLVALLDDGLRLIARYPQVETIGQKPGNRISAPVLAALLADKRTTGSYRSRSRMDGVERTYSFRRLALPQPYYLVVGRADSEALVEWYREVQTMSSLMSSFLLMSVVAVFLIYREWKRNEEEVAKRHEAQQLLVQQNEALDATLARTKRLEGIISICMYCKKIHNNKESWEQLETYITMNSDAQFSHGLCPDCAEQFLKETTTEKS
ncbi:hypothetical protein L4X63_02720 [Geomonas sp. Red32]|uniref:hypothetical protein n=1 Tax=Geomonas sp. Red32 TaxID=2912856 RepID=UPI00202CBAF6|nr:hypothetical protein [Geomonas sp. Red32]MCM0080494.1 hypothetical protein [Geomonas sp. Red32]